MVTLFTTAISGPNVTGGGVCTLAFTDPVDDSAAENISDGVKQFWTDCASTLDNGVTFTVESNPRRYAAATGELQQIFSVAEQAPVSGSLSSSGVPRAAQALIRWSTADIVNGRAVKGRTFIPGLVSSTITDTGQLSQGAMDDLDAAAEAMITGSGGTLSVWHRPVDGAGGSEHLVTSASVWSQFAVLTSRRD